MYKIMLVDDEAGMRNRMLTRIEWDKYGFEIVADAENGVDALEKFEQFIPDVLITDIKMPFMDGLKLSAKVLESYPLTKIIILTGFDDFDYAKKAIGLNVIDYILKPITHDNIVKVLEKTKEMLDKEYEEKQDVGKLKEYFEKSYPLLRNHILHLFVSGTYTSDVAESRMAYYNIDIPKGPYRVGIIQIKSDVETVKTQNYENNKIMLYEAANKIIEERGFGTAYIFDEYIVWLFSYHGIEDIENKKLESTAYEIEQYVTKFMPFNIKISLGHKYDDRDKISMSYIQAESALDYANNKPENEIIFIWDVEPDNSSEFLDIRKSETTRAIKTGSIGDLLEIIKQIFYEIESSNIPEKDYKLYLLEYVFNVIKNANLLNADVSEDYAEEKNIGLFKEKLLFE